MSGLLLAAETKQAFARHETFHPRFGWLKKAFDAASRDPEIFLRPNATVLLGVGKNMVNAIRYWGLAFKVLELQDNPERLRVPLVVPSDFGRQLLDETQGFDPYLEDPASLWLLHWQLIRPLSSAPSWWVAFNLLQAQHFSETGLVDLIAEQAAAAGWPTVVDASIRKDVDCLIRTYAVRRQGRQTWDDVLDCPFRELGLLEQVPNQRGEWRFVFGRKPSMTPGVVLYAALDYLARTTAGESSISVARLCSDPGSPGKVFRLGEPDLNRLLLDATLSRSDVEVAEVSGLRVLMLTGDPATAVDQALRDLYVDQEVPA